MSLNRVQARAGGPKDLGGTVCAVAALGVADARNRVRRSYPDGLAAQMIHSVTVEVQGAIYG